MVNVYKFSYKSDDYTVKLEEGEIKLECYLSGSPTGGSGTECFHTIGTEKISGFLDELGGNSVNELFDKLKEMPSEKWSEFHQMVMRHQSKSFVWHETSWND